ncbi:hypothetical protein JS533_005250 [Bifidobacterium amazonense]|uniref:3-hydroxy-3-methylglutaryl CoA synthase n=1 Tax=Bifidobacterium amazonense TaxID=2809027 RepID=A0ABS9VUB0_9BIFI|nr:hypothetical protein [Bifidobacterium amazonense]MCH9275680.1 hypothetical protein [Bifidobacterium amazonense]
MNTNRIRGLRLDQSHLTIDGKHLSDYSVFTVTDGITINEAKPVTSFQSAPGHSGGWDMTLDDPHGYPAIERREITIRIAATGDPLEIEEAKALIGGDNGRNVSVGGLTTLGEYRGRLNVGEWEDQYDAAGTVQWSICPLTLDAEPYAYGTEQRINLALDGKATHARILGNRPAPPVFHQLIDEKVDDVTPAVATHTFTANGNTIHVANTLTGAGLWDPPHPLIIDCERHRVTWQGEERAIAIDDDYPTMPPGPVTFSGTVSPKTNVRKYTQYVTYTPRWLI